MVILVTADILLRNLANTGFVWSNEISEYALYLMTLMVAPWLLAARAACAARPRARCDPGARAWLLEAAGDLIGFALCLAPGPLRHADDL